MTGVQYKLFLKEQRNRINKTESINWTRTSSKVPRLREISVNSSIPKIFFVLLFYTISWWVVGSPPHGTPFLPPPHCRICDTQNREFLNSGAISVGTTLARSRTPSDCSVYSIASDRQPVLPVVLWWHLGLPLLSWDRKDNGDMIPKVHPCKLAAGLSQARALWGSQAEAWAHLDKTPTAHPRHLNLPTTPHPKPMSKWILQTTHRVRDWHSH